MNTMYIEKPNKVFIYDSLNWTGKIFVLLSLLQFSATSGLQLITIIFIGLAIPGFFFNLKITIPKNLLWALALIIVAPVAVNIPDQTNQTDFTSMIGPGFYGTGLYISLLTIIFFYKKNSRGENLFLIFLATILTIIAGGTPRFFPFAAILIFQVIILSIFLRSLLIQKKSIKNRLINLRQLLALFFVFIFTALSAGTLSWSETKLSFFFSLITPPLSSSSAFAPRTQLNSLLDMQPSKRVVLRIKSKNRPQYLIGQRYLHYKNNGWEVISSRKDIPPLNTEESRIIFPKFSGAVFPLSNLQFMNQIQKPTNIIDEISLTAAQGGTLFSPADAVFAGVNLPSLNKDRTNVIFYPANIKFSGEYLLARNLSPIIDTKEDQEIINLSLKLPKDISAHIVKLAQEITINTHSNKEKAETILQFFHNNFKYGTSYNFNNAKDPLEDFLLNRPPAHCEFFAAGMTILLRSLGVPARYTTGFLVQEHNTMGNYTIVRERDAHAWVEVYFSEHGWVTYDPTPPGAINNTKDSLEWLTKISDFISYKLQKIKAFFTGKNIKEILLSLLEQINFSLIWIVKNPWRIGSILLLVFVWVISKKEFLRWKSWLAKKQLNKKETFLEPGVIKLKSLMDKFNSCMKIAGISYPSHLTVLEWRDSIINAKSELITAENKTIIKEFLTLYSHARYGGKTPAAQELIQLEQLIYHLQNNNTPSFKNKI